MMSGRSSQERQGMAAAAVVEPCPWVQDVARPFPCRAAGAISWSAGRTALLPVHCEGEKGQEARDGMAL